VKTFRHSLSGFTIKGVPPGAFVVSSAAINRVTVAGTVSTVTTADRVYAHNVGGTRVKDYQITVTNTGRLIPGASITFASSNPAIATVNETGLVTHVANGNVEIFVSYGPNTSKVALTMSTTTGATTDTLTGFVAGSFGAACWAGVESRITGITRGLAAMDLFTLSNEATESFTRNGGVWTGGINLTCCPAKLQYSSAGHGGVLVTPRHIVYPAHWQPFYEQYVYFVAADNAVVRRRLMNKAQLPSANGYPDCVVYALDADVPVSITPAKILPSSFTTKVTNRGVGLPLLCVKNNWNPTYTTTVEATGRYATIASVDQIGNLAWGGQTNSYSIQWPSYWTTPNRQALSLATTTGDSGSPWFLVIGNEPILVGTTMYGDGHGTFTGAYKDAINALIAGLSGSGYALTEYDLSAYPGY